MIDSAKKVRIPLFPLYSEVRYLLPVFVGVKKSDVTHMIASIFDKTGTPQ